VVEYAPPAPVEAYAPPVASDAFIPPAPVEAVPFEAVLVEEVPADIIVEAAPVAPEVVAVQAGTCPSCGFVSAASAAFCCNCGGRL